MRKTPILFASICTSSAFIFSCFGPNYAEMASKYLKQGDINRSYENYRRAMYKDSDDCNVLLGYMYTAEMVFDKKIEKFKRDLKALSSKNINPNTKLDIIRNADDIKSFFDENLSVEVSEDSLEEVKGKAKEQCSGGICKMEYAYYRFQDLKKNGGGFLFFGGGCSVKSFIKKYKIKTFFEPEKILTYRKTIRGLEKKYSLVRENALIEHKDYVLKKIKKLLAEKHFFKAVNLINEEISLLRDFNSKEAINQLLAFKDKTLKLIAFYIEQTFNNCSNDVCKRAVYLYTKVFPEKLTVKFPTFWDFSSIKRTYCVAYYISGGNPVMQDTLSKKLKGMDKYFFPEGDCENYLNIRLSKDFDKSVRTTSATFRAPYFDMSVDRFRRLVNELDRLKSAESVCNDCWGSYYNCYSRVDTYIRGIFAPVADIYEYQQRWQSEMNRCDYVRDYSARMKCIANVQKRLDDYYRSAFRRLCSKVRSELSRIRSEILLSKRCLRWKETYYTYTFRLDYSLDSSMKFLNKLYTKRYSDTVEDVIKKTDYEILSGDYNRACEYAQYIGSWNGYSFKCVKPYFHTPPDDYEEEKYLSRKAAENIASVLKNDGFYPRYRFKQFVNSIKNDDKKISKTFDFYQLYGDLPLKKSFVVNYTEEKIFKKENLTVSF